MIVRKYPGTIIWMLDVEKEIGYLMEWMKEIDEKIMTTLKLSIVQKDSGVTLLLGKTLPQP